MFDVDLSFVGLNRSGSLLQRLQQRAVRGPQDTDARIPRVRGAFGQVVERAGGTLACLDV